MKPNLTVFTAICIVMIMLTPGTSADGPPPIPASFTGTVTVNGEPAQDGTVVLAFIDGAEIANAATVNGEYGIGVPGSAGATITFKIYDTVAATATWNSGEFTELDLSVEGVVTPKPSDDSGDSAAPSTTSTPTPTVAITGDIQPEQPTSAPPPEGSGASAESPEVAPTVDQGGEKPLSSIPGFAGVVAVSMLLMLSWLRRNSERK